MQSPLVEEGCFIWGILLLSVLVSKPQELEFGDFMGENSAVSNSLVKHVRGSRYKAPTLWLSQIVDPCKYSATYNVQLFTIP